MRTNSFLLLAVTGLVFCCFSSATNNVAGCQAPDGNQRATEPEVKFYPLQHINAHQAENLIGNVIEGMAPANVTADPRVNSLIIVAEPQMHRFIGNLIVNIDVESREPVVKDPPKQSKLLPLDGLDVDSVLAAVKSSPINGRVDIQVDASNGVVILTGRQVDVKKGSLVSDRFRSNPLTRPFPAGILAGVGNRQQKARVRVTPAL